MTCWSVPSVSGAPVSASARAGPSPSPRSRSVVGHTQTAVSDSPSRAMSCSLTCVACTAVVAEPSTPCSDSSSVGEHPYALWQASFSAGCSETCTCSGRGEPSSPTAASTTTSSSSAGTARTEWTAAATRKCSSSSIMLTRLAQQQGQLNQ